MNPHLMQACQLFLVPATILIAALGLSATEPLKSLLSGVGLLVSLIWLNRLWQWTGLSEADLQAAYALAGLFFAASLISFLVHLRLWSMEWRGKGPFGFLSPLKRR
jgi:hypothetical protein